MTVTNKGKDCFKRMAGRRFRDNLSKEGPSISDVFPQTFTRGEPPRASPRRYERNN